MCTPLGFIRLFGVVGQVLVKPHLLRDVNEEYYASFLEEASVIRKIENLQHNQAPTSSSTSSKLSPIDSIDASSLSSTSSTQPSTYCDIKSIPKTFGTITDSIFRNRRRKSSNIKTILNHKDSNSHNAIAEAHVHAQANGGKAIYNNVECTQLYERLRELKDGRKELDKLRSSTAIQRNLIYPLAMLMLLFLTGLTVLVVVQNTLELLIGIKALPLSTRVKNFIVYLFNWQSKKKRIYLFTRFGFLLLLQQFTLGITSLSKVGPIGAAIEVLIIFYLCATSTVGLYTMPFMQSIRPQRHKTSLSQLIVNGALVLILSSALPLLSRILGKKIINHPVNSTWILNSNSFLYFAANNRYNKFRFAGRFRWNWVAGQFSNCSTLQYNFCGHHNIMLSE